MVGQGETVKGGGRGRQRETQSQTVREVRVKSLSVWTEEISKRAD